jgi:hypothetical protein
MTFPEVQAFAEEAEKLASDLACAGLDAIRELHSQRKGLS